MKTLAVTIGTLLLLSTTLARATEDATLSNADGIDTLSLRSWGGEQAAGWEIFESMQRNEPTPVDRLTTVDGSAVLVYERLRAEKPSITQYWIDLSLQGQSPRDASNLQSTIHSGRLRLTGPVAGDLADMLLGDDDSDASSRRVSGKYVRCDYPLNEDPPRRHAVCELSLSADHPLDVPAPSGCDFFIDKAVHVVGGPNWGEGESVIALLKVSPRLQSEVSSLQFRFDDFPLTRSIRLAPVAGTPGYYRANLETVINPHGGETIPTTYRGRFAMKLKDGRVLEASPKDAKNFVIGPAFGQTLKTTRTGGLEDAEVTSLPSTADSSDQASAYLNPGRCH